MQPTYNIVGSDGQTYGPASLDEIKAWIREGRVSHETQVSRSDQNAWRPAVSFYELGFSPGQPAAMVTSQVAVALFIFLGALARNTVGRFSSE